MAKSSQGKVVRTKQAFPPRKKTPDNYAPPTDAELRESVAKAIKAYGRLLMAAKAVSLDYAEVGRGGISLARLDELGDAVSEIEQC